MSDRFLTEIGERFWVRDMKLEIKIDEIAKSQYFQFKYLTFLLFK
mgnify:CR=1